MYICLLENIHQWISVNLLFVHLLDTDNEWLLEPQLLLAIIHLPWAGHQRSIYFNHEWWYQKLSLRISFRRYYYTLSSSNLVKANKEIRTYLVILSLNLFFICSCSVFVICFQISDPVLLRNFYILYSYVLFLLKKKPFKLINQRRIQNPAKHLRWKVLRK